MISYFSVHRILKLKMLLKGFYTLLSACNAFLKEIIRLEVRITQLFLYFTMYILLISVHHFPVSFSMLTSRILSLSLSNAAASTVSTNAVVLVAKLCPTLCDPMNCTPPGSSVPGISQARSWSGLLFPSPGDLPDPGIEPMSPVLAGGLFTAKPIGKP